MKIQGYHKQTLPSGEVIEETFEVSDDDKYTVKTIRNGVTVQDAKASLKADASPVLFGKPQ